MIKCQFSDLVRGDQFIGEPHGGWIFVKADIDSVAMRLADGGLVPWKDNDVVFKTKGANPLSESWRKAKDGCCSSYLGRVHE